LRFAHSTVLGGEVGCGPSQEAVNRPSGTWDSFRTAFPALRCARPRGRASCRANYGRRSAAWRRKSEQQVPRNPSPSEMRGGGITPLEDRCFLSAAGPTNRLIACGFPRRGFRATDVVSLCPRKCFRFGARGLARLVQRCLPQAQLKRITAMDSFIGFAEIAGAIIAALGLALGLEWVGLYRLTSVMPARRDARETVTGRRA